MLLKKKGILYGAVMIGLLIFLFYNQYSENKYGKSAFFYINNLKTFTQQEKEWLKNKKVIYYGMDSDNRPFEFVEDKDGSYKGIILDYMDILSKELGIKIQPVLKEDFKKNNSEGHENQIDMFVTMPVYSTKHSYLYTYPIARVLGTLVVPVDETKNNAKKELIKFKKIAVIGNEDTRDAFHENMPEVQQIMPVSANDAFTMLKNGQIDGIAGLEIVLQQEIKRLGLEKSFQFIQPPLYEKNYVFAVNESNKILYQILNKGIYNLQLKNVLEGIQQKWIGLSLPLVRENVSDRIALTILIVLMSISLIFYYFYLSNRTLFRELEERMEQLNISRNELQITFDSLIHLMIVVDQFLMILNTNEAVCRYLKTRQSNIIGKYFTEFPQLQHFLSEDVRRNFKKTFEEGISCQQEIIYDGNIFEVNTFPVKDYREQISKVLIMIKDTTQIRINERQLLQENKMAAVGQLAAGVAHEIRNPLGLIRNYCYVLKNAKATEDMLLMNKAVQNIEVSVNKASLIIDNLLNFSRISNEEWEEINLKDYINMVIMLHDNELKKNEVHVDLICDSRLKCIVNTGALEIIFINLIVNAIDAMPEGGEIYIECEIWENVLRILCKDTGVGIEQDKLPKIFEPFFTTKSKKKGTGLGLYLTYNEINKWGGTIRVDSKLGEGTAFYISLPLNEERERENEK